MSEPGTGAIPTALVVDMANVVGSVPDGWWRDRRGAAERLLGGLAALAGATVTDPAGEPAHLVRIIAVLEGAAKSATDPDSAPSGLEIIRASGSGDDEIAQRVTDVLDAHERVLVVTADRGLRQRLASGITTTGPAWLNALLGRG